MSCEDCIHYDICIFHIKGDENKKCKHFKIEANVTEVVRCKDCKKYSNFDPYNCKRLTFHFCTKLGNITKENDFCSYGERKEATP